MPNMSFKYGRRDCVQRCSEPEGNAGIDFCSPADETHPNPHGNGGSTITFFENQFGLNARESIALMGAHTLGHANEQISGFRHYPWANEFLGEELLNNQYYKVMVNTEMFRARGRCAKKKGFCNLESSTFIGDEYGNPMHVEWVVRSQWQNTDGGPWERVPFLRKCDERICETISQTYLEDLSPLVI
jgi:hypothetical protein